MTNSHLSSAASVVRADLKNAVLDSTKKLEAAKRDLVAAKWRLAQFDQAMSGKVTPARKYRTGRSKMILQAVTRLDGQAFTPDVLMKQIREQYTDGAILFPGPKQVTKTINKMLTNPACPIVRVSPGAGRKAPVFQCPASFLNQKDSITPKATPGRMLPD